MTLPAADAQSFEEKTFDALTFIRTNYIKKLNLGEMTADGVKGLYRRTETPLPDDLKNKLTRARELTDRDIRALLQEARQPLGEAGLANYTELKTVVVNHVPGKV